MPIVRYEIAHELRVANPALYIDVPKPDAESLLSGVTMASLAGIVRLIGELSEFAADVFGEIHEDIVSLSARCQNLCSRLSLLEAQLPPVEELAFSCSEQLAYAFKPGLEWHPVYHIDQPSFLLADRPRFLEKSYERCLGPPQFDLVDRFDVDGPGASLKRYTDPSFFRSQWQQQSKCPCVRTEREVRRHHFGSSTSVTKFLRASKFIHTVERLRNPLVDEPKFSKLTSKTLKISAAEIEEASITLRKSNQPTANTSSSSLEHFVDALATIETQPSNDSFSKSSLEEVKTSQLKPDMGTQVTDDSLVPAPSSGSNSVISGSPETSSAASSSGHSKLETGPAFYSSTTSSSFTTPDSVPTSPLANGTTSDNSSDLSETSQRPFSAFTPMSPVTKSDKSVYQNSILGGVAKFIPVSPIPDKPDFTETEMPPLPPLPPMKWLAVNKFPGAAKAVPPPPLLPDASRLRNNTTTGEVVSAHRNLLLDSIASKGVDKLRKVSTHARARSFDSRDSRDVLLEQIRTKSFHLKHSSPGKVKSELRRSPDDNMCAILQKANAMRQAVEGSDEEEDWL